LNLKQLLKILALQAAVVAALVIGYLAWDADAIYEWLSGDVEFGATARGCDLHKEACTAVLGDGTPVTLSVTPRPIPVMQKLQFAVTADGLKQDRLKVEMYGLNMNMGRYSYTLKRDANGTYRGEGMIPSCVAEMQWRANIIAESPTKRVGAYFTFTTE
jgi:hypothetical protein